jgi:hypothetical protein
LVVPLVATTANSRSRSSGARAATVAPSAVHPAALVGGGLDHVGIHRPARRDDRRVGVRRTDEQPADAVEASTGPLAPAPAGGDERRQVAAGATAHEHPARTRVEPCEVADVAQRLVLGEHRPGTLEPRPGVDARGADDEVEQDRRLRGRGRDEAQEPGVVDADARGGEHVAEHPQRLETADATRGDGAPSHRGQVGGGAGGVERGRVEPHALDRVSQHRLGEHLHRGVVLVHHRRGRTAGPALRR